MPKDTELILYRGIYTDAYHAEIIRANGFEKKWYWAPDKYLFTKNDIDHLLDQPGLRMEDTVDSNECRHEIYACASERDACFYALRNKKNSDYLQKHGVKSDEEYKGEKYLYVIRFKADLKDVFIDGNDSLFSMAYRPKKWVGENYDILCQLFTKRIIDKYLPKISDDKYDTNAVINLMQGEDDAILAFYNNKTILINGRRDVSLLSSFRVFSEIGAEDIIEVKEMSEGECNKIIKCFNPTKTISICSF